MWELGNICNLSWDPDEVSLMVVAQQIAMSPLFRDAMVASHIPDAETIVLAQRLGGECDFVLLDEMAAREVASNLGLSVTGFLGTLRFAYLRGLVTVEEVEDILRECQRQGTHYSNALIHDFCEMLRRELPYITPHEPDQPIAHSNCHFVRESEPS